MPDMEKRGCLPYFLAMLSIPFLLFLALVTAYFGLFPLKVELHTLIILGFIFFIFLFFIKHNANYTACKFRNSFYEIEDKLKEFLRKNEFTIEGTRKSLANIDGFLENELKDLRNDNFATVASTIFPMLGILGTFIAIAISMPNFGVDSAEALDREISVLLSGVGTAFYASIYGIFLSLWWIFFEKRGLSKISSIITYINKLYKDNIWTKEELDRYRLLNENEGNRQVVQTLKEIFNIDMIKNLNRRYIEDFDTAVKKTEKSFEKVVFNIQSAMESFENSLKEMYHSQNALKATIKIDETLKEFNASIDSLKETIKMVDNDLSKDVESSFEKIDKEMADIVVKLADFGFLLDEKIEKVFLVIEEYHKEILKQLKR